MDRLSSCYFCGIALDEPLQDYPLSGGDGEPGAVVTLCPGCHRKVETVLEVLLSGEESEVDLPALDAADRPELEGGPDGILTEPDTQEPSASEEPIAMGSGLEDQAAGGTDEPAGGDNEAGSERGMADLFETAPEAEGGVADADSATAETDGPANAGERAADETAVAADSAVAGQEDQETAADADESEAEPAETEPGSDGSGDAGEQAGGDETGDGSGREGEREPNPNSVAESAPRDDVESEGGVGSGGVGESASTGGTDDEPQAGSGSDVMPGPNGKEGHSTESGSGVGSGGGHRGEDDSGVRVSALEYNKVMRLLQNREFPVDREEIVAVAANAYELSEAECRSVIDLAVDRGLLAERGDSLVRPED